MFETPRSSAVKFPIKRRGWQPPTLGTFEADANGNGAASVILFRHALPSYQMECYYKGKAAFMIVFLSALP